MRSRAESLPSWCWRSRRSGPPPCFGRGVTAAQFFQPIHRDYCSGWRVEDPLCAIGAVFEDAQAGIHFGDLANEDIEALVDTGFKRKHARRKTRHACGERVE